MRLSLKVKIVGLIMMPLLVAGYYGAESLYRNWVVLDKSREVVENSKLISLISDTIHQSQIERATTALYMGEKQTYSELEKQHEHVDKAWQKVVEHYPKVKIGESADRIIQQLPIEIKKIRASVRSKEIPSSEATAALTKLIAQFIQVEIYAAQDVFLDGVELNLMSLVNLELGKEYGGRLRARVLNVLNDDKPINFLDVSRLEGLRSGLEINLNSPTIKISALAREKLNQFEESKDWKSVQATYLNVVNKAAEGNFGINPQAFFDSITKSLNDLGEIVQFEVDSVSAQIEQLREQTQQTYFIGLAGSLIILLLVGALSFIVIRNLTRTMQNTVSSLSESADTITGAGAQLSGASQQVASGAVQSASALEEVVASIEELTSIVAQNSLRAKQASELSDQGKTVAENGKVQVEQLLGSMREIAASSQKIANITNVIDDISFQTNLLALNAAVEAARAGEQGKGFAVVADAVRTLAQRSSVAAKDIADLIKESGTVVEQGAKKAELSEEVLRKIVETINEMSITNREIAVASEEQSSGLTQISKAINELDGSTQQNASASEELSAFSEQMRQQTVGLNSLAHDLANLVDGNDLKAAS